MKNVKFSKIRHTIRFRKKEKPKFVKFSNLPSQKNFLKWSQVKKRNPINISTPTIDDVTSKSKRWIKDNIMLVPYPCIVTADYHIPYTSKKWLKRLIQVARDRKVNNLVIAGDFLDEDQFKYWIDTGPTADWDTELQAGREVFKILLRYFDKIFIFLGNHEMRMFRKLEKVYKIETLLLQLVPEDLIGKKVIASDVKYCFTKDKKWIICHPKNYSRTMVKSALDIVAIEQNNVIAANGHKFGSSHDQSGRYIGVECGGMFDEESMPYRSSIMSNNPKWQNGFVLLNKKGEIRLYSDGYEWSSK